MGLEPDRSGRRGIDRQHDAGGFVHVFAERLPGGLERGVADEGNIAVNVVGQLASAPDDAFPGCVLLLRAFGPEEDKLVHHWTGRRSGLTHSNRNPLSSAGIVGTTSTTFSRRSRAGLD